MQTWININQVRYTPGLGSHGLSPRHFEVPMTTFKSMPLHRKLICLLIVWSAGCGADEPPLPADLQQTWAAFRTAVQAGDAEGVARISAFPIRANDFGGKIIRVSVLKQRFARIFGDAVRQCVAQKRPQSMEGYPGYILDCDNDNLAIGFGFELKRGNYRFTYIDNANAE
jgi:hypothetical protein